MNSTRTLLAAAGGLALLTGAAVFDRPVTASAADGLKTPGAVAATGGDASGGDAKGHFANAAFSASPRPNGNSPLPARAAADSGVVVTYDNNRSSVVVTGPRSGFEQPAAAPAPKQSR